ncbi:DinB family protein [Ornithinimicrobium tianjinense]|uniref:DinB superfamily protein n=1 Tax=Ornithinimicrobium tianjinense TaxID=1195761 RepID=A0A917BTY8_9MICO|nr:DinB family protein [Ornithinimicrobium tianjinense]GGF58600.1 hypothetical protein GCM10011366_28030 [Ornithinimicrobium tianjinense]
MATFYTAGERAVLEGFVDVQREQIAALLDDLTEEEARLRLVPSLTTPLALVTHAIFVEKVWFHHRLAGRTRAEVGIPETVDESFVPREGETIASALGAYRAACEESRAIAAGHDLDHELQWREKSISLRYLYGHMTAELARHAGHGDILVEQIRACR